MLSSLIPGTALHPPATHCLTSTRTHTLDFQVLGFLYPQSGPRGPHPVSWGHPRPHTWILKTNLLWPLDSYHSQLIWYFTDHTPSPWAPPSYYLVPLIPHILPSAKLQNTSRTQPLLTTSTAASEGQPPSLITMIVSRLEGASWVSLWFLLHPLQNGFYAAGRMVLLNANHFMSLFYSKPFIGFLHIQSKTFLKCC